MWWERHLDTRTLDVEYVNVVNAVCTAWIMIPRDILGVRVFRMHTRYLKAVLEVAFSPLMSADPLGVEE